MIDREIALLPYPSNARVGPLSDAPWPEGHGIVLHRLDEELPGRGWPLTMNRIHKVS